MKKYLIVFSFISVLFLTACKQESSPVFETKSADDKITVNVQGTRSSSLDPWNVAVNMIVNEKTQTASIEVYAEELNDKNVQFSWTSESQCIVTFTQRDGQVVSVPITVEGL